MKLILNRTRECASTGGRVAESPRSHSARPRFDKLILNNAVPGSSVFGTRSRKCAPFSPRSSLFLTVYYPSFFRHPGHCLSRYSVQNLPAKTKPWLGATFSSTYSSSRLAARKGWSHTTWVVDFVSLDQSMQEAQTRPPLLFSLSFVPCCSESRSG